MANPEFQPPPTWANPMLEVTDPATGERKVTFNPVWLKWFVDLTSVLTNSGAGTGTINLSMPAMLIPYGSSDGVLIGSDEFRWDDTSRSFLLGEAGTGGAMRGVSDGSGGAASAVFVNGGDGAGGGGDAAIYGGDSASADGGYLEFKGGAGATLGGAVNLTGGAGGAGTGGNVVLTAGSGGTPGEIVLVGLPTSAPAVSGALWRDAGAGNVVKCVP